MKKIILTYPAEVIWLSSIFMLGLYYTLNNSIIICGINIFYFIGVVIFVSEVDFYEENNFWSTLDIAFMTILVLFIPLLVIFASILGKVLDFSIVKAYFKFIVGGLFYLLLKNLFLFLLSRLK